MCPCRCHRKPRAGFGDKNGSIWDRISCLLQRKKIPPPKGGGRKSDAFPVGLDILSRDRSPAVGYFTVIETAAEGIPLAITTSVLAPVSAPEGTSKLVET